MEKVLRDSGLNIEELAKMANVSPRTIRDWKGEKFNISQKALDTFCEKFQIDHPQNTTNMIDDWRRKKLEINRNGGLIYYQKYGSLGTPEGRRRGGLASLEKLRKLGLAAPIRTFHSPLKSVDLAEFVGIMLGDGNIGKLQISVTLNSIADADYSNFVSNLCNKLFGCYPKITKRKDCNALDIHYNGINLVKLLTEIGMKVGNKVKQQVKVPDWVTKRAEYKVACLRGLMDTDGGVFIHKYMINGKKYSYRKICFSNQSVPLLRFVYDSLNELGFTAKMINKVENKKVWLYNTHEVTKYFEVVKSNNQRLNKNKF